MSPLFGSGGHREREPHDRSSDERERARVEREARRAAREGRPPRDLPPLPDTPPAPSASPEVDERAPDPTPSADLAPPLGASWALDEPQAVPPPLAPAFVPEPEPEPAPEPEHAPAPAPAFAPAPAPAPASAQAPRLTSSAHEAPPLEASWALDEPPAVPPPLAPAPEPAPAPAPPPTPSADQAPPPDSAWAFDGPPAAPARPSPTVLAVPATTGGEAPVGVRRVAASSLASAAGAEGPPRFGAPPRGVPKRRRGARRIIPLLFLVVVVVVAVFAYRLYQPGTGDGDGRVAVIIPPGSSAEQIGKLLARQDVVASSFFFSLRARLSGENLRAGRVVLRRGMSYEAALAELGRATAPAPVLAKITLPEGPSRKELASRVEQAGFTGSYVAASLRSPALDPRDYGAPAGASLEGFLFPATYQLKPGVNVKALVAQQLRAFKRALGGVDLRLSRRRKLTRFDVVTIASMIEREAQVPKDRRLISAVIYNRLKEGMPLGIDATIRYDLENFSRPLKASELKRDTPYNTRTRTGLPPGPIGNPGLASLEAAANPAKSDFVYYVVKPCANGAHAFSSTDAEFQRDVAAYNAKRDALGGKDPSQC